MTLYDYVRWEFPTTYVTEMEHIRHMGREHGLTVIVNDEDGTVRFIPGNSTAYIVPDGKVIYYPSTSPHFNNPSI